MPLGKESEEVPGGTEGLSQPMSDLPENIPPPPSYEEVVGASAQNADQKTDVDQQETNIDEPEPGEERRALLGSLNRLLDRPALGHLAVEVPCPLASGEDTDGLDTDAEDSHSQMRRRFRNYDSTKPSNDDAIEMKPLEIPVVEQQVPLKGASDMESSEESDTADGGIELDEMSARDNSTNGVAMNRGSSVTSPEDVSVEVPPPRAEYRAMLQTGQDYGYLFQDYACERGPEVEPDWTEYTGKGAWLVNGWRSLSDTKKLLVFLLALLVIGLILLVTLLPASFVYVEYYEYAMSRNKWTGVVDTDSVYDFGCHLLAPQDELVRFPSTLAHVGGDVEVMTNESLWVNVYVTMQYRIKKDELGKLYRRYDMTYKDVVNSMIGSTIKNVATDISLDQFRLDRNSVEAVFKNRLQEVLSGDCCKPCCSSSCAASEQCSYPLCRPPGECYRGHHVELTHFQLGRVWVPDSVTERYMKRILLQVQAEREFHLQEHALEVKNTERAVRALLNEAKEVHAEAMAKKLFIDRSSEARAKVATEKAYQTAMAKMFSRLNITKEENKLSFMQVKAFESMKHDVYQYGIKSHTLASP